MAGAGITQSICLPLLSVYQLSSNGTGQVSAQDFASCNSRVSGATLLLFPHIIYQSSLVAFCFLPLTHG